MRDDELEGHPIGSALTLVTSLASWVTVGVYTWIYAVWLELETLTTLHPRAAKQMTEIWHMHHHEKALLSSQWVGILLDQPRGAGSFAVHPSGSTVITRMPRSSFSTCTSEQLEVSWDCMDCW